MNAGERSHIPRGGAVTPMIRSMTGYGQGSAEIPGLRVTAELRSVNHRFADLRMRLPDELSAVEAELRAKVLSRVRRGRVELDVRLEHSGTGAPQTVLNRSLVESLLSAAKTLREEYQLGGQIDLGAVLGTPGILQGPADRPLLSDDGLRAVTQAVESALEAADGERLREGELLRADLSRRLERMAGLVGEIGHLAPRVKESARRRLTERLSTLGNGIQIDPSRLAQEVALLADRSDVTEELVRLDGHLEQAQALLRDTSAEPIGKRLDFLLQEIHRETNTVNSKSADLEVSRRALDLKAETEKVREQVQNLE